MTTGDPPKISVIIPVYMAENYLRPCIDSVLAQSYENFELLLIDDGSTDSSGAICDEYAKTDKRITVYHRQNQGVSKTRNFGMQHASGEYILFVDADDLIQPAYIEKLYGAMPEGDANAVSMCRFQMLEGSIISDTHESLLNFCAQTDSLFERFLNPLVTRKIYGTCWRVLFPKRLLEQYSITFFHCKIAEDMLFFMEVISHCSQISVCDEPLYLYRQFDNSSSHRNYITNYLPDRLAYLEKLQQILSQLSLDQVQRQWLLSFSFQFYRMLVYMNATASPDFRQELASIDASPFGTTKVPEEMKTQFARQIGRKHRILNYLVCHRMFAVIAWIRNHKKRTP